MSAQGSMHLTIEWSAPLRYAHSLDEHLQKFLGDPQDADRCAADKRNNGVSMFFSAILTRVSHLPHG